MERSSRNSPRSSRISPTKPRPSSPVIGPFKEKMMYVTPLERNWSRRYSRVVICSSVRYSSGVCQYATTEDSFMLESGRAYPNALMTLSSPICSIIQLWVALRLSSASGSSPSKSKTTMATLTAPSGHFSSMCSNPTRVSSSGGKASRDAIEKSA